MAGNSATNHFPFYTLAPALASSLGNPAGRARLGGGAARLARPDASERLADLVEAVAFEGHGR